MNNHAIDKEIKLKKIINNLNKGEPVEYIIHRVKDYYGNELVVIEKHWVQVVIGGILNITDHQTVNAWINILLAKGVLSHNPDSNGKKFYLHYDKCTPSLTLNQTSQVKSNLDSDTTSTSF